MSFGLPFYFQQFSNSNWIPTIFHCREFNFLGFNMGNSNLSKVFCVADKGADMCGGYTHIKEVLCVISDCCPFLLTQ